MIAKEAKLSVEVTVTNRDHRDVEAMKFKIKEFMKTLFDHPDEKIKVFGGYDPSVVIHLSTTTKEESLMLSAEQMRGICGAILKGFTSTSPEPTADNPMVIIAFPGWQDEINCPKCLELMKENQNG